MGLELVVAELAISFGISELQKWMAAPTPDPRPKRLTEQPTTNEGDPVPLIYGRVRVWQPVLAWYGGYQSYQASQLQDPSNGGITNAGTSIYSGMNMLFVLGIPGNHDGGTSARLLAMWENNEKSVLDLGDQDSIFYFLGAYPSPPSNYRQWNNNNGILQFFAGTDTQQICNNAATPIIVGMPSFFSDVTEIAGFMRSVGYSANDPDPTLIPSYRGQMLVALSGNHNVAISQVSDSDGGISNAYLDSFIWGIDSGLPRFSFEVSCSRNQFGTIMASGDCGPADVIYDLLTSPWGKLGLDPALVDTSSFSAAAATLRNEQHGFSYAFDGSTTGTEALQMVINQIGGSLYTEPTTGKIVLKLHRNDYDPLLIPSFNADHVLADPAPEYTVGNVKSNVNQVEIKYTSRAADYAEASVFRSHQASAVAQSTTTNGRLRPVTINYPGCTTYALASALADRDLQMLSQPLASIRLSFNRRYDLQAGTNAASLRPGSVFKLTLPDYFINGIVFRVTKVDLGTPGTNAVVIEATQDQFWLANATQTTGGNTVATLTPLPSPINHYVLTEAPRWLQQKCVDAGIFASAAQQRIWSLCSPDDSTANGFDTIDTRFGPWHTDTPTTKPPDSGTLTIAVAREAEPYDTTVGITVQFPNNGIAELLDVFVPPSGAIATYGSTLMLVGGEIVAWEDAVKIGTGLVHFTGIWRGLLDTPAVAHAIGERVYLVGLSSRGTDFIGRRTWTVDPNVVSVRMRERTLSNLGNGGEPTVNVSITGRCVTQLPAHNLAIAGERITGTQGMGVGMLPAPSTNTSAYVKSASLLEEDIRYLEYRTRDLYTTAIRRGDDASEPFTDANIKVALYAQKVGGTAVALIAGIANDGNSGYIAGALLGGAGYGQIDVIVYTTKSTQISFHPVVFSTAINNWDAPRVRVFAPSWRNLLSNARFRDSGLPGTDWATTTGLLNISTVLALPLTGDSAYPGVSGSVGNVTNVFAQTIDVSGYLPRAMDAVFWFHTLNINADADDTVAWKLYALDAAGATLTSSTLAAAAASQTVWTKKSLALTGLPANTAKLKIEGTLTAVTGGDTRADCAIAETALYLGQFLDDVLGDPSFDTGVASWTVVTGGFVVATASPFACRNGTSSNYAQGGAFASSEIRKDYTLPTGREFGTFVLRCWRMNAIAGDTGAVIVEVYSGTAVLLASTTTGVEAMASTSIWYPRTLSVQLPEGAATVRVRLQANRAAGAGNSGACFDELHAQLHKDLDPVDEHAYLFSSPTVQPAPTSWQGWHTANAALVDAGIPNPLVLGPDILVSSPYTDAQPIRLHYSDGSPSHAAQYLVGQWGGGLGSVPATRFTRQSGPSALDVESYLETAGRQVCNPRAIDSFTAMAFFRVDETGFATACGLFGRRDGGAGWGVEINAAGALVAVLIGSTATITATRTGSNVADGAVHMALISYDAVGGTLTIRDERGATTVSTSGMGEIFVTSPDTPMRLGRDISTVDTLPGMLTGVYYWTTAAANTASHWNYAKDPTGLVTSTTRTQAVLVPGAPDANGDATLSTIASDQFALGYHGELANFADAYVGGSYGLPIARGSTNLIPSWNFSGASWSVDSGVTMTTGVIDPTGRANGANFANVTMTNGVTISGVPLSATVTLNAVFWARATASAPTLKVELYNASGVLKGSYSVTLPTKWTMFRVGWVTWDGSTPTAKIKFSTVVGTAQFDLGGVMWAAQVRDFPSMFPTTAGGTLADVSYTISQTLSRQYNAEGEIIAEGAGFTTTTGNAGSIVEISNNASNKNARELICTSLSGAAFNHYDATVPTNVSSNAGAIDWAQRWRLRGRWCSIGMLDVGLPYAGVVVEGASSLSNYGRVGTFSYDATNDQRIRIGTGASGNSPMHAYLRRVLVRTREQKLA